MWNRILSVLVLSVALVGLVACGGGNDEGDGTAGGEGGNGASKAPAAASIVGTWTLDKDEFKKLVLAQMPEMPADDPMTAIVMQEMQAQFDEMQMTATVSADGTWRAVASGMGPDESESGLGTWTKSGEDYVLKADGEEDARVTVIGDTMRLYPPEGAGGDGAPEYMPLKRVAG